MAGTEYSNMPLAQRVRAYRGLAAETRREAGRCKGFAREAYFLIAEQWDRLAADIDSYLEAQDSEAFGQNGSASTAGRIAEQDRRSAVDRRTSVAR